MANKYEVTWANKQYTERVKLKEIRFPNIWGQISHMYMALRQEWIRILFSSPCSPPPPCLSPHHIQCYLLSYPLLKLYNFHGQKLKNYNRKWEHDYGRQPYVTDMDLVLCIMVLKRPLLMMPLILFHYM